MERDFICQVIQAYKSNPCLWSTMHVDYHNKEKRNQALDNILRVFIKTNPQATRETVLKKISAIRGAYRKELKRVQKSLNPSSKKIHVPKLWYFSQLSFLNVHGILPLDGTQSIFDIPMQNEENIIFECRLGTTSPVSSPTRLSPDFASLDYIEDSNLEKPDKFDVCIDPLLYASTDEEPSEIKVEKVSHQAYGEYVAEKLRSIPEAMVPYCQKLINDAIFLAELEALNMNSRIVSNANPTDNT